MVEAALPDLCRLRHAASLLHLGDDEALVPLKLVVEKTLVGLIAGRVEVVRGGPLIERGTARPGPLSITPASGAHGLADFLKRLEVAALVPHRADSADSLILVQAIGIHEMLGQPIGDPDRRRIHLGVVVRVCRLSRRDVAAAVGRNARLLKGCILVVQAEHIAQIVDGVGEVRAIAGQVAGRRHRHRAGRWQGMMHSGC